MRRGLVGRIFNPLLALCVLIVAEVMQMSIILIVAQPFDKALTLVQTLQTTPLEIVRIYFRKLLLCLKYPLLCFFFCEVESIWILP